MTKVLIDEQDITNPFERDTTELEREIDEIVYKLYGLTEEEIRIIEESVEQK